MTEQDQNRDVQEDLSRASDAFQAGRPEEADRIVREVLIRAPENGDAHYLRAAILTNRGELDTALPHAQKAAELKPDDPRVLGNLGAVLIHFADFAEALKPLDKAVALAPNYNLARRNRGVANAALEEFEAAETDLKAAAKLEPKRAETRLLLAEVLIQRHKLEAAAAELAEAEKLGARQTARWVYTWACLMFQAGNYTDARNAFAAVRAAGPDNIKHYQALAAASFHANDLHQAEQVTRAWFKRRPARERAAGEPELRVLVLEALGSKYFTDLPSGAFPYARGNFPGGLVPGRVAYTHVISDCIDSLADSVDLQRFDLALNNRSIHEAIERRGLIQSMQDMAAELPVPLINPPDAVAACTRDKNAARYATSDRFIFPHTIRVRHEMDVAATRERILDELELPIILRPIDTNIGKGAKLLRDDAALTDEFSRLPFSESYAIQFHDCRQADGFNRRYRLARVGGRFAGDGLRADKDWNVHGWKFEPKLWSDAGLEKQEKAFFAEPAAALDADPDAVFAEIVENTGLDIYGIDFGFHHDGRVVVYEVNASMALAAGGSVAVFPYRRENQLRIQRMMEKLFFEKAGKKPA